MKAYTRGFMAGLMAILTVVSWLGMAPLGSACELDYGEIGVTYARDGLDLIIPSEYEDLLLISTTPKQDDRLFSVSEKASVQAGKSVMENYDGMGWLFDIGRVNRTKLENMLCYDMSGVEVFAKDSQDSYYVLYHPTDVRYMRENNEAMVRDAWQWEMLTNWSYKEVCPDFILDNAGLKPIKYDNSVVGILLAQTAYRPDGFYSISSTKYRPVERGSFNSASYVERLICNAQYNRVEMEGTLDGDYITLNFPNEGVSLNFFLNDKKENLVQVVHSDGRADLYKGQFDDTTILTSELMEAWLAAISR